MAASSSKETCTVTKGRLAATSARFSLRPRRWKCRPLDQSQRIHWGFQTKKPSSFGQRKCFQGAKMVMGLWETQGFFPTGFSPQTRSSRSQLSRYFDAVHFGFISWLLGLQAGADLYRLREPNLQGVQEKAGLTNDFDLHPIHCEILFRSIDCGPVWLSLFASGP